MSRDIESAAMVISALSGECLGNTGSESDVIIQNGPVWRSLYSEHGGGGGDLAAPRVAVGGK